MADDVQSWFRQGEHFANQGFYREALVQFDRVLAAQPHDVAAWVYRAVMLLHLERFEEALESCDRALALNSTEAEAWLFRGVALQRLNRYPEAYASYERGLGDGNPGGAQIPQTNRPSLSRNWLNLLWQSLRGWT